MSNPTPDERHCEICGKPITKKQISTGQGKYCGRACHYAGMRGREFRPGGRYKRKDGYVAVKTGVGTYQLEHRLVMSEHLGRKLATDEHVHHLNGVKDDNRLENLQVLTNSEHQRVQNLPQTRPRRVALVCKRCGKAYEVKASKVAASNFCSNACKLPWMREQRKSNKKPKT